MINISDRDFNILAEMLKKHYGINLAPEKKYLVIGRLQTVLWEKRLDSFSAFIDYLAADKSGKAMQTLVNRLTTNHTFFMREPQHFEYLKTRLLPQLCSRVKNQDLRIWSAGCSSGEEAYTLAMLLSDFFRTEKKHWDTKILATDISSRVLQQAREGIYRSENLQHIPPHWNSLYFTVLDDKRVQVKPEIQSQIIFRYYNLMARPFPFKKLFHIIFCRNVMIYFDQDTRRELVDSFYQATETGGYLFTGHSESLSHTHSPYNCIGPAIYRKGSA